MIDISIIPWHKDLLLNNHKINLFTMHILAFDTTNQYCSVAILVRGLVIAKQRTASPSIQSESLFAIIDELFLQTNLGYKDLDFIAVAIGPGSFTGVRIGVAAAKGIALVTKIPLLALTNFQIAAGAALMNRGVILNNKISLIAVILNAIRDSIYVQKFDSLLNPISEACVLQKSEVNELLQEDNLLIVTDMPELTKFSDEASKSYFPLDGMEFETSYNFIYGSSLSDNSSCYLNEDSNNKFYIFENSEIADNLAKVSAEFFLDHASNTIEPYYLREHDAKKMA